MAVQCNWENTGLIQTPHICHIVILYFEAADAVAWAAYFDRSIRLFAALFIVTRRSKIGQWCVCVRMYVE